MENLYYVYSYDYFEMPSQYLGQWRMAEWSEALHLILLIYDSTGSKSAKGFDFYRIFL